MESPSPVAASRIWTGLAVLSVVVCMGFPLLLLPELGGPSDLTATEIGQASAATAALGAFFRAGARQLVRSTVVTALRATTRTASRRAMRRLLPLLLRVLLPSVARHTERESLGATTAARVAMGTAGLGVSFFVVAWLQPPDVQQAVTVGLSLPLASAVAAAPVLFHFTVLWIATRVAGVQLSVRVPLDGLLVQAYFTGAGSFLPILMDVELTGDKLKRGLCSVTVLVSLLGGHVVANHLAAGQDGIPAFLSGVLLIYAFIGAFPLHPLDGRDIWDMNKGVWLAVWLTTAWLFLSNLPTVMYGVL